MNELDTDVTEALESFEIYFRRLAGILDNRRRYGTPKIDVAAVLARLYSNPEEINLPTGADAFNVALRRLTEKHGQDETIAAVKRYAQSPQDAF